MATSPTPSPEFQGLIDQVTATNNAEDAAAQAFTALAAKYEAAIAQLPDSAQKAQLVDLTNQLKAHTDPLSAAVVAGTPAEGQ